jgi:hypothetical protein
MKRFSTFVAALVCGVMAISGTANADSIVGDFTLDTSLNTIASEGQVIFTLNGDGTIAASLTSFDGNIIGFGFDSVTFDLPESNFTPAVSNPFGWSDGFGTHASGFLANVGSSTETWTIGNPGDFSSVMQALGGGTASVDFFLYAGNNDQFGANAHPAGTVPEPSSMALIGFGGLGLAVAAIRRRRQVTTA